jgi:hypothetical protein
LHVDQIDDDCFVATQLDNAGHQIVGGHIAGQALMAASRTAPGRTPHSVSLSTLCVLRRLMRDEPDCGAEPAPGWLRHARTSWWHETARIRAFPSR